MFDTGDILYFCMPKTGTTSSIRILEEHGGAGAKPFGWGLNRKHAPARMCWYFLRDNRRMCVGTIRPPMEWYGSVYNYGRGTRTQIKRSWSRGQESFEAAVRGFTHPQELEDYKACYGVILGPGNVRDYFRYCETGLWSWSVRWFYQSIEGNWLVDRLVDTRHLASGWEEILGVRVPDMKLNVSTYRERFKVTSEMERWVTDADGPMIEEIYGNVENSMLVGMP